MGRNALIVLVLAALALGGGAISVLRDSGSAGGDSSAASSGKASVALGAPLLSLV